MGNTIKKGILKRAENFLNIKNLKNTEKTVLLKN